MLTKLVVYANFKTAHVELWGENTMEHPSYVWRCRGCARPYDLKEHADDCNALHPMVKQFVKAVPLGTLLVLQGLPASVTSTHILTKVDTWVDMLGRCVLLIEVVPLPATGSARTVQAIPRGCFLGVEGLVTEDTLAKALAIIRDTGLIDNLKMRIMYASEFDGMRAPCKDCEELSQACNKRAPVCHVNEALLDYCMSVTPRILPPVMAKGSTCLQ